MDKINPQKENGYTSIANSIVEKFCSYRLSGQEWQILWVILRKTYGWNKKEDDISFSQFAKLTNLRESHIARTLKRLTIRKLIRVTKIGNSKANTYSFNKHFNEWQGLPFQALPKQALPKLVQRVTILGSQGLPKLVNTKDTLTKDTIQKKAEKDIFTDFEYLKSEIFKKTWEDFLEMREKKKAKPTDRAKILLLNKLHTVTVDIAIGAMEESIMRSWTGIFFKDEKEKKEYKPEPVKEVTF